MKVDGVDYRAVWVNPADGSSVEVIDQTLLPWSLEIVRLETVEAVAHAIRAMQVRGAPLIGAVAAYGMAVALRQDSSSEAMEEAAELLAATRPTAVNLRWALERMLTRLRNTPATQRVATAYDEAGLIADEDVAQNRAIGTHGQELIAEIAARRPGPVNVLTHCNAGWLATVDWGTALSPIYTAHDAGMPVHVWVDETRPRNQGAFLTAWELGKHGVPHTVISDNAGGHLMQHGRVDLAIVGTDRVSRQGDVANKIGTYLKALAARDNDVPFWVATPSSTIDWTLSDGVAEIPIEERDAAEVTSITGRGPDGAVTTVRVVPSDSPAANPAFDVTPARLVTGLITERGRCAASLEGLRALFPRARRLTAWRALLGLALLAACTKQPPLAPPAPAGLIGADAHLPPYVRNGFEAFSRRTAVAVAEREWRAFGSLVDDDPPGTAPLPRSLRPDQQAGLWQRVADYWWLGQDYGAESGGWSSRYNENGTAYSSDAPAWSAAFISYVMRVAGAGTGFPFSALHADYIKRRSTWRGCCPGGAARELSAAQRGT